MLQLSTETNLPHFLEEVDTKQFKGFTLHHCKVKGKKGSIRATHQWRASKDGFFLKLSLGEPSLARIKAKVNAFLETL